MNRFHVSLAVFVSSIVVHASAVPSVTCRVETDLKSERVTHVAQMSPLEFTFEAVCGLDALKMSGSEIQEAMPNCRAQVIAVLKGKLTEISSNRFAQSFNLLLSKVTGVDVGAILLDQGVETVADLMLLGQRTTLLSRKEHESIRKILSAKTLKFKTLVERFQLIPADSEEGRNLERADYRLIRIDGVKYFEPSFGLGEYQLGRVANIAAAKALFDDATDVLINDHFTLGSTLSTILLDRTGTTEIGLRVVAVLRSNGELIPVVQILKAPRRARSPDGLTWGRMNVNKIEIIRQIVLSADATTLDRDLIELPELATQFGDKSENGSFRLKAACGSSETPSN